MLKIAQHQPSKHCFKAIFFLPEVPLLPHFGPFSELPRIPKKIPKSDQATANLGLSGALQAPPSNQILRKICYFSSYLEDFWPFDSALTYEHLPCMRRLRHFYFDHFRPKSNAVAPSGAAPSETAGSRQVKSCLFPKSSSAAYSRPSLTSFFNESRPHQFSDLRNLRFIFHFFRARDAHMLCRLLRPF